MPTDTLTLDSPSPPALHIAQVYRAYVSLIASAPSDENLGGQFLYTGELNPAASHLIRAANIAGAASLAASATAGVLRQAQQQGVIDFLVNSLDEALRILKNEIRKRQPVAVAVALAPQTVTQELLARGVLPNLLPPDHHSAGLAAFVALGANPLAAPLPSPAHQSGPSSQPDPELCIWQVPVAYTNRAADFEAILQAYLLPADKPARHWLHLSPRYLETAARRYRSIPIGPQSQEKLTTQFGPPLHP